MTIPMTPAEVRPTFLSYTDATWQDGNHLEHTEYMVHAMKPGPGFEIIDTRNYANWSVASNFATEADAQERMRTNCLDVHRWRRVDVSGQMGQTGRSPILTLKNLVNVPSV